MYGSLPGLFLVEFPGYWENEPGNEQILYVNPGQVTVVSPHVRDDKTGAVTHYVLYITDRDFGFVVHHSELQIVPGQGDNDNAIH